MGEPAQHAFQSPLPACSRFAQVLRTVPRNGRLDGTVSVRARPRSARGEFGREARRAVRPRRRRAAARRCRAVRRRASSRTRWPSTWSVLEGRGPRPEALDRRVRLDRLRRVDADHADRLGRAAVERHFERVAVDGPHDAPGQPLGRLPAPASCCHGLPGTQEDRRGDQQQVRCLPRPFIPRLRPDGGRNRPSPAATGCGARWRAGSP